MALDSGVLVDYLQLFRVSRDFDLVSRDDSHYRKSGASGFPALGATTSMVVCHVTGYPDFDFVLLTIAMEGTAGEAGCTLLDTGID
jgi:hypothetical protein